MMAQHAVQINPDLIINTATLRANKIVSGKSTLLTVKAVGDAATIVVLGADSNPAALRDVFGPTIEDEISAFQAIWCVFGNSGDILIFTVILYDTLGRRSSNTKQLTVTIRGCSITPIKSSVIYMVMN